MTATHQAPPVATAPRHRVLDVAPGLLIALLVAGFATVLGQFLPIVGGPVFGILTGALLAVLVPALRHERWNTGYATAAKPVLQLSIVVLGTGLSLPEVLRVGSQSLPVMLGTLAVALGGAWLFGRLLGVRGDAQILIGVGTGICGASAIAATTGVIKAKQTQVAYAIGTIFTFNIAAVLLFPVLGHLLGMSAHSFGLWSGTAINDTSSVVAAAYSFGGGAGAYAIVVKLTRSLMLIPIVIALAIWQARKQARQAGLDGHTATGTSAGRHSAGRHAVGRHGGVDEQVELAGLPWRKIVPLFLIGFVAAAGLDSLGLIPTAWHPGLSTLGTFLITTALAGIGLSMRLGDMRKAGPRPLLLGAVLWIAVAVTSLGLQAVTGTI
ncbi:MAG TPA: putative sulfate exporter family transporter [Pseudonocardiaceae bacterium]|jgi:uncharacterized integral membrane protein (TIGR00698 family)|nr:putative sulfate exporter family transporter [Pseudonocardiaceae bacterium]